MTENPEPCYLENLTECCVFCWVPFGGEDDPTRHVPHPGFGNGIHYSHGPVVHPVTGTEYETVMDSEGGTPLAHPGCRKKWLGAIRTKDRALTEWSE